MLLLVGLVACNKQESTTTKLLSATTAGNKIPMVVDPNQLADLRKSTLKEGMPVYNGDGFALNAETWILCTANQFGEIDNCHIDIRGRNATTGKQYDIRKWDFSSSPQERERRSTGTTWSIISSNRRVNGLG